MENRNISIRHSLGWSIQISKQKQIYQKLIHYSKISRKCNRMVKYFNQTTTNRVAYQSNSHRSTNQFQGG